MRGIGCAIVVLLMLPRTLREDVEQSPAQAAYCEMLPKHRTCAFFGGLQSGKSVGGADALYELLYVHQISLPEQIKSLSPEVWILSKSYALADQAWAYFRWRAGEGVVYTPEECKELHLERGDSRTHWLRAMGRPDRKPIRLRIRTAHDPEQLRATGVLLVAWCDEIAHWPELAWLNLQGRGIVTPTRYLITTTPKGRNWLYRDVYTPGKKGSDPAIGVVECRSVDNPWADKEYLEKLRVKFGPEYAAQELDAMFTASVGYVYDFDRLLHMKAPPSKEYDYYKHRVIGVDPGYGDPYAACVWLKDWDEKWWMADELYFPTKAIVDDVVPTLREWTERWKVTHVYVDKRRPSDWEALRRKGLNAQANVDVFGENDRRTVMPMIRMVQRLFREGRIHIAPHCEWWAEEAENYAFKDSDEKNSGENPVDHWNHLMDASRYAICSVDAVSQGPAQYRWNERLGKMMPVNRPPRRPGEPVLKLPTLEELLVEQDKQLDRKFEEEKESP